MVVVVLNGTTTETSDAVRRGEVEWAVQWRPEAQQAEAADWVAELDVHKPYTSANAWMVFTHI